MPHYTYSRWGSPTSDAVSRHISELYPGAVGTLLFASGMAAIYSTLITLLKQGDGIVAPKNIYGGAHEVIKSLAKFGVKVHWVDSSNLADYRQAITKTTKVIYGETSSNPRLSLLDLGEFAKFAKSQNLVSVVDNTFASPYLINPLEYNVDIVIESATSMFIPFSPLTFNYKWPPEYLNGHSDVLAGIVTTASKSLFDALYYNSRLYGATLSPFDTYLLDRGIKTLAVRMESQCQKAHNIAMFLENHPKILKVYYPSLKCDRHFIALSSNNKI